MSLWGGGKSGSSKAAAGSSTRWGGNDGGSWEEKNWDSVQKQEQLKQEVLVKASQNSERIRQMVRETDQTTQVAKETLNTLDQQSEQLKRMHGEVDKIDANLNFADRTIRGMESIMGSVRNYFTKPSAPPSRPTSAKESDKLDKAAQNRASSRGAGPAAGAASGRAERGQREYGEDWKGKLQKMEDQQDDDLDELSKMVGQLKGMGMDMSHTLDAQTKSIEKLNERTDAVDARLSKSNLKIKRML